MRDYVIGKADDMRFEEKFPAVQSVSRKEMLEYVDSWKIPCLKTISSYTQMTTRLRMLFNIYISSVPFHRRKDIFEIRNRLTNEISDLVQWILLFRGLKKDEIEKVFDVQVPKKNAPEETFSLLERYGKNIDVLVGFATRIQLTRPPHFQRLFVQRSVEKMYGSVLYRLLVLMRASKDRISVEKMNPEIKKITPEIKKITPEIKKKPARKTGTGKKNLSPEEIYDLVKEGKMSKSNLRISELSYDEIDELTRLGILSEKDVDVDFRRPKASPARPEGRKRRPETQPKKSVSKISFKEI
jgi:hypothetical protein